MQQSSPTTRSSKGRRDEMIRVRGQVIHPLQLALHAKNDGEQIGEIMRQTAGQLCRHFAPAGLLQRDARLGFFGDVHG